MINIHDEITLKYFRAVTINSVDTIIILAFLWHVKIVDVSNRCAQIMLKIVKRKF